MLIDT